MCQGHVSFRWRHKKVMQPMGQSITPGQVAFELGTPLCFKQCTPGFTPMSFCQDSLKKRQLSCPKPMARLPWKERLGLEQNGIYSPIWVKSLREKKTLQIYDWETTSFDLQRLLFLNIFLQLFFTWITSNYQKTLVAAVFLNIFTQPGGVATNWRYYPNSKS